MSLPQPSRTKFTIYGAKWCPYCTKATDLLTEKRYQYNFVDIDSLDKSQKQQLTAMSGMTTIPVIYCQGDLIGGYTDLVSELSELSELSEQ
jgi:glutaredoxin 3